MRREERERWGIRSDDPAGMRAERYFTGHQACFSLTCSLEKEIDFCPTHPLILLCWLALLYGYIWKPLRTVCARTHTSTTSLVPQLCSKWISSISLFMPGNTKQLENNHHVTWGRPDGVFGGNSSLVVATNRVDHEWWFKSVADDLQ